jgi:DNA-binding XRE family transcriptional regulator
MLENEASTLSEERVDASKRHKYSNLGKHQRFVSNLASFEMNHRWVQSKHRLNPWFALEPMYHARMPRAMRIDPDAARFGAILKQLREQRGWTRQKLAQRSGVTPTYIGILEYGGNIPSLPTVLELIEVLGADIADVMRRLAAARISPPPVLPPEPPAET